MALLNVLPLSEDIHPVHRSGWYESLVVVFLLDIRCPMSLFFLEKISCLLRPHFDVRSKCVVWAVGTVCWPVSGAPVL